MSFASMLNNTVIVYRKVRTEDALGSFGEALTEIANIPCRIRSLSARERAMNGQLKVEVSHRIYTNVLADITEDDRFKIGDDEYDVQHINRWDKASHHFEIDVLERRATG